LSFNVLLAGGLKNAASRLRCDSRGFIRRSFGVRQPISRLQ
jgi:hypothetical protein